MAGERFNYEGYLVFTPILANMSIGCKSTIESPKPIIATEDLPQFEAGDPTNPGRGFEEINLESYSMSPKDAQIYNKFLKNVSYVQFKCEEFNESEVFVDGEIIDGYTRDIRTVDLFWFHSGLVLFRGRKNSVNKAINFLEKNIRKLFVEHIDISPEFLSYIYDSGKISNKTDITLNSILAVEFEGANDISKTKFSVAQNRDIRNHPQINESRYPIALMAIFEFLSLEILVNLRNNRFHIQSSSEDLSDCSEMRKMLYSILFSKIVSEKILEKFHDGDNL